jgi:hypothetical protein
MTRDGREAPGAPVILALAADAPAASLRIRVGRSRQGARIAVQYWGPEARHPAAGSGILLALPDGAVLRVVVRPGDGEGRREDHPSAGVPSFPGPA